MSKLDDYFNEFKGSYFEFGRKAGIDEAEKHIIKLLLQHPICVDSDGSTYCDHADCDPDIYWKAHFIELIEGETE